MNKGVSITLDLALVLVVMLVVLRGYGRSWLATLFTYHKTDLQLAPQLELPRITNPFEGMPNPLDNLPKVFGGAGGGGGGSGGFDGGGGDGGGVRTFDIPLVGGGEIHTLSSDYAGALANVRASGNEPATA